MKNTVTARIRSIATVGAVLGADAVTPRVHTAPLSSSAV